MLCLETWWLVPRCSCILVSSTLFGRSPALGTIVVQGLGLLRMFVSLIFFLQLCQYHPVCHYFYGARGDGYFYQSECIEAFYWFFALFLLKSGTRGGFVLARVCSSCAGVNISAFQNALTFQNPFRWRTVANRWIMEVDRNKAESCRLVRSPESRSTFFNGSLRVSILMDFQN